MDEENGFWLCAAEVENGFEDPDAEKGFELKSALPRFSGFRSGFVFSSFGSKAGFSFAALDTRTPRIALILPSFFWHVFPLQPKT